MEMLVTLVIVSMISTLLWQAMQQVQRVERVLQSTGADAQLQMVRREWLRSLLEAALPDQQNALLRFQGNAVELQLASAEASNLPGLGSGMLRLALNHEARNRMNRLVVSSTPALGFMRGGAATVAPVTLLTWSGPEARLKYMDPQGRWLDDWPQPGVVNGRLPSAILVEIGIEAGGPLVAGIVASETPRTRLVDWERQ